jgi:hypothetical protein
MEPRTYALRVASASSINCSPQVAGGRGRVQASMSAQSVGSLARLLDPPHAERLSRQGPRESKYTALHASAAEPRQGSAIDPPLHVGGVPLALDVDFVDWTFRVEWVMRIELA